MRILFLTPFNPNLLTPETGFANELHKIGHIVTLVIYKRIGDETNET